MVDIRQYLFSKCIYLVSMRLPSDPRKRLSVDVLSQPTETLVLCAWKWLSDYLAQLSHSHRLLVCCLIFRGQQWHHIFFWATLVGNYDHNFTAFFTFFSFQNQTWHQQNTMFLQICRRVRLVKRLSSSKKPFFWRNQLLGFLSGHENVNIHVHILFCIFLFQV